ncbi:MAG TPA: primosomal protein N' [Longimicrobiales bacterium]
MLVDVALPLPIPRVFTYRVDEEGVAVGARVLVPFRGRPVIGWITGPGSEPPEPARVRAVSAVLDREPTVTPELLRLCRWVADYYVAPLGQVLRAALPTVLSDTRRPAPAVRTRRLLRITRELPSLQERDELFGRARRQRACYEALEGLGGSAEVAHLTGQLGFSADVLRGLVARGVAEFTEQEIERDPFAATPVAPAPRLELTPAQRRARDALVEAAVALAPGRGAAGAGEPDRRPFLLLGVTGSGKTLVYIELLREVVERQGRGAIVLVPEIALTPQTVARFRAHFGDRVAVLHSALSDGERYDAWRALRSGTRRVVVGARSSVFAPVQDLGAIIVDEEHETTYKQSDEAPRYHAREVAIMRAQMEGAVCVLGSATPSLESWHNAQIGKYRLLELPERVEGRPLPPVRVIDLRRPGPAAPAPGQGGGGAPPSRPGAQPPLGHAAGEPRSAAALAGSAPARGEAIAPARGEARDAGAPSPRPGGAGGRGGGGDVLTPELVSAMRLRLERGEQIILLLNRRGYATFIQCRDCGHVWRCRQCNVALTYHRSRRRLVCHYCFHEEPPPVTCPRCASGDLSFRGIGTEQVERAVIEAFPAARVARMDVDTTSGKWSHHEILERVGRGEVDILLGTQMIAKGLDFPGVTLVGVVNADVGLNLPDFRATERTFQLLTQVAGRAGRGPLGGEVLIQTALPNHYAIRAALAHDYKGFAARELDERREPRYPPHRRLANVVVSGTQEVAVQEAADRAATWVRAFIRRELRGQVEATGPAPCPIDRIRGRWRWHFLLRSQRAEPLGRTCHALHQDFSLRAGRADLRLAVDRDPVALL